MSVGPPPGSTTTIRLWSVHPSYLDRRALVAVWREGLLARAVLRGETRGYRHHPQLDRFRSHPAPLSAINRYLAEIVLEGEARGYRFSRSRIGPVRNRSRLSVSRGQLEFELMHLRSKIRSARQRRSGVHSFHGGGTPVNEGSHPRR